MIAQSRDGRTDPSLNSFAPILSNLKRKYTQTHYKKNNTHTQIKRDIKRKCRKPETHFFAPTANEATDAPSGLERVISAHSYLTGLQGSVSLFLLPALFSLLCKRRLVKASCWQNSDEVKTLLIWVCRSPHY